MVTAYERDQARIAARRKRNEVYYNRLISNPKQRALGVDKSFLDAQVAEKEAKLNSQREADRMYAEQTAQIVDILETQKLKLDEEKCLQDASYKACWDVQVSLYITLLFLETNVALAMVFTGFAFAALRNA